MPWPLSVVCSKSLNLSVQGNVGFTAGQPHPGHLLTLAAVGIAVPRMYLNFTTQTQLVLRSCGQRQRPMESGDEFGEAGGPTGRPYEVRTPPRSPLHVLRHFSSSPISHSTYGKFLLFKGS
jgi:hypothetical protein